MLGLPVLSALLPLLLCLALLVDLARWAARRRPFMAVRLTAFLWVYLAAEAVGLVALLGVWIVSCFGLRGNALLDLTWRFQQLWTAWLFGAAKGLFGLRLKIEGDEHVEPGPLIVLVRHASIVDNLLPSVLIARRHQIRVRYVLKRELLGDPCIDVAAKRLPNYFVRRDTGEQAERDNVRRLAEGLGARDAVLLYPEGTRFTPQRRARAITRIAENDPQLAQRAAAIERLLPPRPGGVLAVLEGAPGADVLIVAHHGFDGLRLISDIWRGSLVGRTISVRFTRVARADVPAGSAAQVAWLYDTWQEVDDWVGTRAAGDGPGR